MPVITAVLHTENDALRLGRALETLYPCDEIVIVDHGSLDGTVRVAREYGARVVTGGNPTVKNLIPSISGDWILCLDPRESLTEGLAASLFEWKSQSIVVGAVSASVILREETATGWVEHSIAQTRLVPSNGGLWNGQFPLGEPSDLVLPGELLRFAFP